MSASTLLNGQARQEEHAKIYRFASPVTLARNSLFNLLSEVWTFAVLVIAMPILVSRLGKDGFGLFSLAWVVLGYMAILDLGVSRAATKFISEELPRKCSPSVEQISRTAVAVNLVLGLVGGAIVVAATPLLVNRVFKIPVALQGESRVIFYTLAAAIPVLLVQAALRGVLSSYQQFGWINLLNSIAVTSQWGFSCVLALKGTRVDLIVTVAVLIRVIITIAYGVVVLRTNRALLGFSIGSLEPLEQMLHFGGWVSVSQFMTPVFIYLDRMLIASMLSIGIMTVYVIPYEVITRLRVIPGSLVTTLFPSFSERSATEDVGNILKLYNAAIRYLLVLLLPCFLFLALLGSDVISVWVGSEYAHQGAIVLEIMALGALLNSLAHVPYTALQALGRPDIPAKLHVLELPIYVALSLLFIPNWGITGAAIAVTIRLILDSLAMLWAARKYVRCRVSWYGLTKVLGLNLVLAVTFGIFRYTFMFAAVRLIAGAVAVAVYLMSVWFVALDGRDKPLLLRAFRLGSESAV